MSKLTKAYIKKLVLEALHEVSPESLDPRGEDEMDARFDVEEEEFLASRMHEPDLPVELIDGVMVVSSSDVLELLFPTYWSDYKKHLSTKGEHPYPSYQETSKAMDKWAKRHGGFVYSWEGPKFKSLAEKREAVRQAKKLGKKLVVIEYLS